MEWVIQTHGLTKTYKGVQALKSLDLRVPEHAWPEVPPFFPGSLSDMSPAVALGQPLVSAVPIVSTAVLVVLFVLAALWRFGQEEF